MKFGYMDVHRKLDYKVPHGKLLRIFLDYDNEKKIIEDFTITGDFFAYPEESIEYLEKELLQTKIDRNVLFEKINLIVDKYNIKFIGLNVESLVDAILMCLK